MQGLQPLLAFCETAKHGGFALAARELGIAPSTLAKSVARFESQLGLRLLHRTTRHVSLTADGERLFQRCQRVLAELEELQSEAAGTRAAPSGTLRINMPIVFGRLVVVPVIAKLILQYPALKLDARFSDAYVDLVKEGIDVAIRVGQLQDSTLVARRFASMQLILVAAPSYLRKHGTPGAVQDLAGHRHIVFRMPSSGRDRPQQFSVNKRVVSLQPEQGVRMDDGEAMVKAAVFGLGLAQIPDQMAAVEIAKGSLVEVLPECRPPAMPVHAVLPANRMVPARVRVLLDALDDLKDHPRPAGKRRSGSHP